MGSDETRAKITVNDTLTIKQVLQGVWRDFDVQGVSLEADGDRLLIASNLQEALDTYQRIEAPSRALREKMSFVLWNQGVQRLGRSLATIVQRPRKTGLLWSCEHSQQRCFAQAQTMSTFPSWWIACWREGMSFPMRTCCWHRRSTVQSSHGWIGQMALRCTRPVAIRQSVLSKR